MMKAKTYFHNPHWIPQEMNVFEERELLRENIGSAKRLLALYTRHVRDSKRRVQRAKEHVEESAKVWAGLPAELGTKYGAYWKQYLHDARETLERDRANAAREAHILHTCEQKLAELRTMTRNNNCNMWRIASCNVREERRRPKEDNRRTREREAMRYEERAETDGHDGQAELTLHATIIAWRSIVRRKYFCFFPRN